MHETIIARKIIEQAEAQGHVTEIYLELGELGHVPPEELIACLKELVDWKIHYTEKPAKVRCSCGFEGHPDVLERGHDHFIIECPQCKGMPEVIDGTDFTLQKVVVD